MSFPQNFCQGEYGVSTVQFTTEFDAILNTPNGEVEIVLQPNVNYYLHLEPGTTENFTHAYFGDVRVVFDIPNYLIKIV